MSGQRSGRGTELTGRAGLSTTSQA